MLTKLQKKVAAKLAANAAMSSEIVNSGDWSNEAVDRATARGMLLSGYLVHTRAGHSQAPLEEEVQAMKNRRFFWNGSQLDDEG